MTPERRRRDRLVVACTTLSVLCAIVVVLFVAPTVLDTSAKTDQTADLTMDNCMRIHRMYDTLDGMVYDGRASLQSYLDDGTINRRQYDREIARIDAQRDKLAGADCPRRARPPTRP